jgi:hypothetical protein
MFIKKIIYLLCILNINAYFSQNSTTDGSQPTEFEKKIFAMNERIANDPRLQTASIDPDSVPSLPIGIVKRIGETVFIVAIDSAVFENDKAYFSAYMALDFPGATRKLAFAAKNVNFNPKGVLVNEGVKLQLVSDVLLHLGPNLHLFIKGDGSTYVEFDCNGYKRTRIKGEFRFLGDKLEPVNSNDSVVTANVDVMVEDLQNLYASVTFSPFMIKDLTGYEFEVSEATVDLSDFQNPSAPLPTSYIQTYGNNQNLWRGFYLKNLTVTLPRKISDKNGSNTQIGVNDLFIDDSGVTGGFFANNVLATNQGDMSGWGFSITRIDIGLQSNQLIAGHLAGVISVEPLDDTELTYSALISKTNLDLDYSFTIGITDPISVNLPALSSTLIIFPNSTITVSDNNPQDKFIPTLNLNGKYSIHSNKATIDKVVFQNFVVTTRRPYLMSATFSLNPESGNVGNFPLSINQMGFTYNSDTSQIIFTILLGLNLGDATSKVEFSANTRLDIYAFTNINQSNQANFTFDRITIGDITFEVNTTPFNLAGVIVFKDDDPVFGKLFYGAIQFRLNNIMDEYAMLRAGFGRITNSTNTSYKYWFVDGQVPVNITMGQVAITKIIGGASYHVKPNLADTDLVSKIKEDLNPDASIPFTPDDTYGLAFKAGVGFKHSAREEIVNGDAVLGVLFNANGGFASIDLIGNVFMLVNIEERYDANVANKIYGNINANYTHETKTFHTNINGTANFGKAIEGNLNITVHIDPNDWYVWFNRPSQRAEVRFLKPSGETLLSTNFYMMFGTIIDPMGSLPTWASSISSANNARYFNLEQAASANGLCIGTHTSANLGKEYKVASGTIADYFVYLSINMDLGFDLMIVKYPPHAVCSQTGETFGINQHFCNGQLYFRAFINAGGKRVNRKNDNTQNVDLFTLDLRALLQGTFPKPTYFAGTCYGEVKFIGIDLGTYQFNFDLGQQCNIVQ